MSDTLDSYVQRYFSADCMQTLCTHSGLKNLDEVSKDFPSLRISGPGYEWINVFPLDSHPKLTLGRDYAVWCAFYGGATAAQSAHCGWADNFANICNEKLNAMKELRVCQELNLRPNI